MRFNHAFFIEASALPHGRAVGCVWTGPDASRLCPSSGGGALGGDPCPSGWTGVWQHLCATVWFAAGGDGSPADLGGSATRRGGAVARLDRSEERRVGKECRSR